MHVLRIFLFSTLYLVSYGQEWNAITPVPSSGRDDGVAFSLNGFGYIVTGTADGSDYSESNRLFQYTPEYDFWVEKSPFPGVKRQYASSFVIEDKAYVVGGYSETETALRDVWMYTESLDIWTQLNNFPGFPRWDATSTSLNGFGYFGLGTTADSTLSDLWQYNPKTDTWTIICHYPGGDLRSVLSFPLLNNIIFGEGFSVNPITYSDKWFSFNTNNNSWQEMDSPIAFRAYGTAVSNSANAIVYGGVDENGMFQNDCYQLNYEGEWTALSSPGSEGLKGSSGFVIGNNVYVGTGIKANGSKTSEFYSFSFPETEFVEPLVFPNPSNNEFNVVWKPGQEVVVYSIEGKFIASYLIPDSGLLTINELPIGLFILHLPNDTGHRMVLLLKT